MRALRTDLRYAGRLLAKNPTFTAIVVINLALGIGANSAVFSVVNAVMLRSLPYRDQDRLVVVWEQNLNRSRAILSRGRSDRQTPANRRAQPNHV